MSVKLWPWTVLVLAVKPEHARLHRRLQMLLDAGGQNGHDAVRELERRARRLQVMESFQAGR
jgi:hypothetical protein